MAAPPESRAKTAWMMLGLVEFAALAIAAILPVTPGKTGSDWSFAEWFWPDPSYLQQLAVNFVMTNLLVMVLALVLWLLVRRDQRASARGPSGS